MWTEEADDLIGRHTVSISAISTPQNSYQSSPFQSFRQDFGQLVSALNSGDLSGAQQAYSALSQLQGNGQGPNPSNPLSQALAQIGQALQNNNLNGAQQALAALQQSSGSHHSHGHHHHSGGTSGATGATEAGAASGSTAPSNTGSGTNTVNITA